MVEVRGWVTLARLAMVWVCCCRSFAAWAWGRYRNACSARSLAAPGALAHARVRMFPFLGQPCDLGPRLLQVLFQRLLPAEGAGAGTGSHSHPVLRHPLQGNGPGSHQRGRDLCQQLIQGPLVGHPKVRQHVVVDGHPSTQPPVSIVFLAQARQLPGTAYPFHSAEQPQGQQHFRVRCGAARPVQRRFDGAVEGRQVQLFQQAPDSPGRVVFSQRCIQVPGQKLELLPVWLEHASLLGTGRRRRYPLLGWRQFEQRRFSHSSPPKHLFPLLSLIPTRRARPWGCIYSHALSPSWRCSRTRGCSTDCGPSAEARR